MGLLISVVNGSDRTKYVWLSNQKCMIQSTLINLHPSKYSQNFSTIHLWLIQKVAIFLMAI